MDLSPNFSGGRCAPRSKAGARTTIKFRATRHGMGASRVGGVILGRWFLSRADAVYKAILADEITAFNCNGLQDAPLFHQISLPDC
jgi:hypothetical protein